MRNGNYGGYSDKAMRARARAIREEERAMEQEMREEERVMREEERVMREEERVMEQAMDEMDVVMGQVEDGFQGFSDEVLEFRASSNHGGGTNVIIQNSVGASVVVAGGGSSFACVGGGGGCFACVGGDSGFSIVGGEVVSHSSQNPPQTYRMGPATVVMSDPANFNGQFSCTSSRISRSRNGEIYSANSTATFGPGGVREMHSTEKNQNGQKITVERGLGERSRRITRTRDQTGREEARDTLRNIQFEETDAFDQEWSQAARRLPGGNNNGQGQ